MGEIKVPGWIVEIKDAKTGHESIKFYAEWNDVTHAVKDEYLGCTFKTVIITPLTLVPEV